MTLLCKLDLLSSMAAANCCSLGVTAAPTAASTCLGRGARAFLARAI